MVTGWISVYVPKSNGIRKVSGVSIIFDTFSLADGQDCTAPILQTQQLAKLRASTQHVLVSPLYRRLINADHQVQQS
jgi:hypothetical protein